MCTRGAPAQVPRWQIVQDPGFHALLDHTLRRLSRMKPRQLANGVRALAGFGPMPSGEWGTSL